MTDENKTCAGCGQTVAFDNLTELDGEHFCTDCVKECDDCGSVLRADSDELHSVGGKWLCDDCCVECSSCGGHIASGDAVEGDGNLYCQDCFDESYVACHSCGTHVHVDDGHTVTERIRSYGSCSARNADVTYCDDCYGERYISCESCGCEVPRDDSYCSEHGDGPFCSECYSERYTTCDDCGCEISRDDSHCDDNGDTYCGSCWSENNDCDEWEERRVSPGVRFVEIRSTRKFGIELETSECDGADGIREDTCFGSKHDGSISGKEFVSPVLSGDEGLEHVRKFCRVARNFHVDNHCGFHLHLDMSDECTESLRSVAFAYAKTQHIWMSFVNKSRRSNHFCKALRWNCADVRNTTHVEYLPDYSDRYQWLNLVAYRRHRTFEVRLHTATLSADKVCNWIKAHTRFADWASRHTIDEINEKFDCVTPDEQFAALAEIWDDAELTEYYRGRARKFGMTFAGCADMSLAS